LALAVMRNVTTRDAAEKQQPFNLRVPGGVQTLASDYAAGDKVYDVTHLQFMQADQIRGSGVRIAPTLGGVCWLNPCTTQKPPRAIRTAPVRRAA
jgi:hypothetical protein